MNINDLLVYEEGERLSVYQDHLGYWTIGVGILVDERNGGGITKAESRHLLQNRIAEKVYALSRSFPWFDKLDDVRQAALISMAYQLGFVGLLKFRKTLEHIGAGDFEEAAAESLRSNWAVQTPARAQRTSRMIATGEWPEEFRSGNEEVNNV